MIDESQFFNGLVEFVVNGIDLDNKHFIVSDYRVIVLENLWGDFKSYTVLHKY